MIVGKDLALKIAQAVCGDNHLKCSWPDCGCKSTKQKIGAVMQVVAEAAPIKIPVVELALTAGKQ